MDKIIKDIELKVKYYALFTKTLKQFIQDKVTQHPDITLNDFEFEIFQKIGELYDEMNSGPDMVGFEGQGEGDY